MKSVPRVTRLAAIPIALTVSAVPGFSQSTIRHAVTLERTSTTAVRQYDPAVCATPAHAWIPSNLIVAAGLHQIVEEMLQSSGTFRRQCLRIANAPHLIVRIEPASRQLPSGARAYMRMARHGTQQIAIIQIPALDDTVELIAHELEHVVEQLDGVNLRAHAGRSDSSVRALASDEMKFETVRARRVGVLVALEVRERATERRAQSESRANHRLQPRQPRY